MERGEFVLCQATLVPDLIVSHHTLRWKGWTIPFKMALSIYTPPPDDFLVPLFLSKPACLPKEGISQ